MRPPTKQLDESVWEALLLVEHCWLVADEQRLGELGREDGWAIVDELGFGFTELREALVYLRPSWRGLNDIAIDHRVDAAMKGRFPAPETVRDPRPYLLDLLKRSLALVQGVLLAIEHADFLLNGRVDRMAAVDHLEEAEAHVRTAVYGVDPRAFLAAAVESHDEELRGELIEDAVDHEIALERSRRVERELRALGSARRKWERAAPAVRDKWRRILPDLDPGSGKHELAALRRATGMTEFESRVLLARWSDIEETVEDDG